MRRGAAVAMAPVLRRIGNRRGRCGPTPSEVHRVLHWESSRDAVTQPSPGGGIHDPAYSDNLPLCIKRGTSFSNAGLKYQSQQ